MHILTGLLISALFSGRKTGVRSPLLERGWPVRTAHLIPGRVRFQIPAMVGKSTPLTEATEQLARIDGVKHIEASAVTGSILIRYDERQLQPDLLCAALIRLLGLEAELERTPPNTVATGLRDVGRSVNLAVRDQTGGFIDLRTAVPLTLGAIGVIRLLSERTVGLPGAFTMVWWAYTSLSRPGGR